MKRMKNWWQIFVLCCAFVLTATIFVSCDKGVSASTPEPTPPDQTAGETTTTPTTPDQPDKPTTSTEPDEPDEPIVTPHQHTFGEWYHFADATCQHPDIERRECTDSDCDVFETREVNQTIEHNCVGTITTAATCTEQGCKTFICQYCGDSYTETIPYADHDYTTTVIEPTCEVGGYTLHQCRNCNHEYTSDDTPATGHTYSDTDPHTCTQCGATRDDEPIVDPIDPIENIEGSYWYLAGKWAICFETFDPTLKTGKYHAYAYSLENGVFIKGNDLKKYDGDYTIIKSDNDTITIDFEDTYLANKDGSEYLANFTLKYEVIEDEETGETIYTLKGDLIGYENRTLIFAGYGL